MIHSSTRHLVLHMDYGLDSTTMMSQPWAAWWVGAGGTNIPTDVDDNRHSKTLSSSKRSKAVTESDGDDISSSHPSSPRSSCNIVG